MVPEANSQCGGFGSACCRFTSECLSLEAKSVRFGELHFINPIRVTGSAGRRSPFLFLPAGVSVLVR